ncbi:DNA topoisomerase IV, alpha subunit [Xylariaceae sp. FL0662B]|nr:DNA topoisomerase IV, alpha subunit [Xylariaceae sp. FL0662B]
MESEPWASSSTMPSSSPSPSAATYRQPIQNRVTLAETARSNVQTGTVIAKIEDILEGIVDALSENRVLIIPLRSRQSGNGRWIRFPADNDAEVKRFTCLLQILHMSHEALVSGNIITKRNVYYQNPGLFGTQQYVDNLVDDIAFTFGAAACKGLLAGKVQITLKDGSLLDCSSDDNGTLIPQVEYIRRIDIGEVKWILVIEKEATFRGLASSRYFETSFAGPGILVTAKGYPDLITRQFLHIIHSTFPRIPIQAVVDFDPHGIAIMLTYKLGSHGLRHEENVTVPGLSWLGPKSFDILGRLHPWSIRSPQASQSSVMTPPFAAEIMPSPISRHHSFANSLDTPSPLTVLDRLKVTKILRKLEDEDEQNADEMELMHELQLMLMLNLKAEIQAVDEAGRITGWLDENLSRHHD